MDVNKKETSRPLLATSSNALVGDESSNVSMSSIVRPEVRTDLPIHGGADGTILRLPSTFLSESDLGLKFTGDILVALSITFGVSPFLSVIDKAIVQKAAGTHSILQSSFESTVNIARNPGSFIRSPVFLAMWGVYAATYSTANCLKTVMDHNEEKRVQRKQELYKSSDGLAKFGVFATTTAINSSTTMLKDKFYAKHFGAAKASLKVPMITYGLWGLRDCMVIGSSFILPDVMSGILEEQHDFDKKTAQKISQFACPVVAQFAAGPVQLLGLDLYNRPLHGLSLKEAMSERVRFQVQNFGAIVGARISRIAPAYGIGGIGNTYFRDKWRDQVLRKEFH